MKIGCAAFTITRIYRPPFEEAIRILADNGFQGCELIASAREDFDAYYTPARVQSLVKLLSSRNLEISEFVINSQLVEGLASFDRSRKAEAYDIFHRGVVVARDLGTKIICTVSHWPDGLKAPIAYPPSYIHVAGHKEVNFSPKLRMKLPDGFNWDRVWDNYIESIQRCCEIAGEHGLSLALETHVHTIISTTDGCLRMFEAVQAKNLGVNLDTGFPFLQREYLPLAVHKLGRRILHVHVRDGDGLITHNLPAGAGIVDWDGFVDALAGVGYDGFLSVELSKYEDPLRYANEAKDYLQRVLARRAKSGTTVV